MSETGFKGAITLVGTVGTYLLGGWDTLLEVLLIVTALDVLTGLLAAVVNRDLDSREMWRGGVRKVGMFAIIALAAQLDRVMPIGEALFQTTDPVLRTATVWFFLAHEGLSVVENAGKAGLPVPEGLQVFLRQLKERGDAKEGNPNA